MKKIANICVPVNENNAQWPQTLNGQAAIGICNSGYSGSPTRVCSLGVFGTVSNPCSRILYII